MDQGPLKWTQINQRQIGDHEAGMDPCPAGNAPRPQKWSEPRGSGRPNKGDSVISFQFRKAIMKQYVNFEQ